MIMDISQAETKITRALCDSDFDGCVCAAILKEVFPDIELFFTDPHTVQCGKFNEWVGEDTVVADLPYIQGVGLYFDHHVGNNPQQKIVGHWAAADCAAQILYKIYEHKLSSVKYQNLLTRLAAFDSGKVLATDVINPDIYMQIGFAIDRKDNAYHKFFAEYLAKHDWESLINHDLTQAKLLQESNNRDRYLHFVKKQIQIDTDLAVLDLRNYQGETSHSFFVTMLYPQTRGLVIIKYDCACTKINFYSNIFSDSDKPEINFLDIARTINPEASGGHKGACGCTIPTGMSVEQAIKKIKELL